MKNSPLCKYAAFVVLFLPSALLAGQTVIQNYNDARDNYFYDKLYTGNTGESLYCGIARPIDVGGGRSLEHVMPADWMAEHFGCDNRDCDNVEYKHAEGDLHNLWLAVKSINSSRRDHLFGEIDGERRFGPNGLLTGREKSFLTIFSNRVTNKSTQNNIHKKSP